MFDNPMETDGGNQPGETRKQENLPKRACDPSRRRKTLESLLEIGVVVEPD
jgi:hypothetical protein